MPKFIVTKGSHFTPFTYDELVKPVLYMQEQHNAAQEAYDTLGLGTNALDQYISEDDVRARELYDSYREKLERLQNNLWEHGYTAQTRRELSEARNGYARDIERLNKAIQARQERSKEYWDMRHKNPDMVMGADPGSSSLDRYLEDDNFGRDYYTYDGNAFAKSVGADAQALAQELIRSAGTSIPVPGYTTVSKKIGFTGDEVNNAGLAVKSYLQGNAEPMSQLDDNSKALASVLLSHLKSSGASDSLDPNELDRLVDYGIFGLKAGVGGIAEKDYTDRISVGGASSGGSKTTKNPESNPDDPENSYDIDAVKQFFQSKNSQKDIKASTKYLDNEGKSTRAIVKPNGTPGVIKGSSDAEAILDELGRSDFISKWGIDPDDIAPGKKVTFTDENGNTHTGKIKYTNGYRNIYAKYSVDFSDSGSGTREFDKEGYSKSFNDEFQSYQKKLNDFKRINGGFDIRSASKTTKYWNDYYKNHNIPAGVAKDDIPAFLNTRANIGDYTPATIVMPVDEEGWNKARKLYGSLILDSHIKSMNAKGKIDKTSSRGLYKVDRDNKHDVSVEAEEGQVFDNTDAIRGITASPEDVIAGRARVSIGNDDYAISPEMLGNNMAQQLRAFQEPASITIKGENGEVVVETPKGIVEYLMTPILDPGKALTMDDDEKSTWSIVADKFLGRWKRFCVTDEDGNLVHAISPDDITRSYLGKNSGQKQLREAVVSMMDYYIAQARDYSNIHHFTWAGNGEKNVRKFNR